MASIYNPILGRHQEVSDADAQYLAKPLAGDRAGTRMLRNPLDGKHYAVPEEEYQFLSKPGRTLADAYPPPELLAPPKEEGVGLADYGKSVMAGGASVAQGFGWLTKQLGAESIGSAIEELGRNAVDYWSDSLSDAAKDALSREFVHKADDGSYEWGDASLHTVGLMGAQSLLGTAAGAGAGAGITKVMQLFANPFGRAVLTSAARSGSIQAAKKLRLVDRVIGAAGFGIAEGLVGGSSAGASVEQAVRSLPPETLLANERYQQLFRSTDERLSELEKHQYATEVIAREAGSEAGFQSGLLTALLGAPMGAFFGPLLGASGRLAGSRVGSAALSGAGEAAQEALQSAGEAAITTTARQRYGEQDLDALEEAINAAFGGAAAGGALGTAIGAVDFRPERPDVPHGTSPDTAAPLKNAAMRAAQAGAPRDAVLAEVQANDRPLIDRIASLRKLAATAAAQPEPATPPTYGDVLAAQEGTPAPPPKQRTRPTDLDVVSPIDEAAHRAATSPLNPTPPPTPEQIEAENYEAGRVKGADIGMRSLDFAIEYPRGTERGGITMKSHYGRIPGVVGGDGMSLDFFMGNADSDTVYLYHHIDKEGRFTQHKPFIGFASEAAVREELEHFYRGFERNPKARDAPLVALSKAEFEQWAASGKTGAPHPKAGFDAPRQIEGQATRAVTPAGEAVNARYELVELGDLVSSHTLTGRANSRFPQELQPRDRSRAGLRQWIIETAARFEPALAVEGASAGEGAPIVGPDNVIESGNGRTMVINKLYLDKSTKYRDYLKANAAKFGFTPEQVEQLSQPVLVRRRTDPMDMAARARFATEANRPNLSTFSATEQARSDARTLTEAEIGTFNPGADGNVLADSNRTFVQAFIGKLPATERAGLLTADGAPTRQLANRIQAAVFSSAYQDDRLLALMAEEANPDVRNVVAALTAAAPAFARARAAGTLQQADVVTPLVGAIEVVRQARAKGQSVAEYLGQQGLFGNTPPDVDRMARFVDANIRSAKRMGEAFTAMATFLETEGARRQSGSLFGEEPALDVGLAMQAANQRMVGNYGGSGQTALFSQPPQYAPRAPGEDLKSYMKRAIDPGPAPESVPFAPERLFTMGPDTQLMPMAQLVPTVAVTANKGGTNAPKRFLAAYHGAIPPRDPVVVRPRVDGRYNIVDGNGTVAALRALGWPSVPVVVRKSAPGKREFLQGQLAWPMAEIYQHAVGNQAKLVAAGREIAADLGVEFVTNGIKNRARLQEKLDKEGYQVPGEIVDVVRGRFLVDSAAEAEAVVEELKARFPVFDKGIVVTPSGFVDRKTLVRFPDGQVGEYQIGPPAVVKASDEKGTTLYHEQRALLVNGLIPDEHAERHRALEGQQIELYAHALATTPGWFDTAVSLAEWEGVVQSFTRARQLFSSSGSSFDSSDASTLTQPAPGEGITNAPMPPSTGPDTNGRSSSAPKRRTELTGRSTGESVAPPSERVISDIQDFGDLKITETVEVEGEGPAEVSRLAQRAFEKARDRVKILERVQQCLAS